ncbi:beta-mannosidase [Rhizoctonia solani]|uniref:Beta-mannosidase B n=1 Tax=Rhizoctonia solani TaxID=456999 RepID=A0A0K6FLJ7_9AGAM|nr:beta-mannosidase [Rhizoctonia solani]
MSRQKLTLSENWQWKQRDPKIKSVLDESTQHGLFLEQDAKDTKSAWRKATTSPSEIHVELLKVGIIPDPYTGFNEHKVQWVGKREWLYLNTFEISQEQLSSSIQLEFEGLDTFCTAYMNGVEILNSNNMFTPSIVWLAPLDADVAVQSNDIAESVQAAVPSLCPSSAPPQPKHALKLGTNSLLLHFKSALLEAEALEEKHGKVRAGPELMTVGPYRPIHLHIYSARIADAYVKTLVSPAPELTCAIEVIPTIHGSVSDVSKFDITLRRSDGSIIRTQTFGSQFKIEWKLNDGEVSLWWPVGYGQQTLYYVDIIAFHKDGTELDRITKRVGFRRVELVQEPLIDAPGTTFLFEINGVRIFIGGSNWIPADNFLTTITPERYRAWLQLLRDGNQNMVRVWGGGVYEPDCFYDTCDELGILVWQDFQFACGQYPAHEAFVASVEAEAEANVRRLRGHPSLALWCGNNEDYQQVFQWGISTLPAVVIYEKVLPNVIDRLMGDVVPYHRGSPYGSVKEWDTADPTIGDIHQWDVWAGKSAPYQDWDVMGGRFVSEFGLPCLPDIHTIDYWLQGTDPSQRRVQSKAMQQHNKAGAHERRLAIYMNENFWITNNFETYAYLTQVMQSEAVASAYRMWRRDWKGKGKQYCAGVIVWQLNDCWPVSSWAIVDYFLRPKLAYYTIAREMLPYTVGIKRTVKKNRETDRPDQFYEFGAFQSIGASIEVWGTNSTLFGKRCLVKLTCVDLVSDWNHVEEHPVTLLPNQATEILAVPCPCPPHTQPTPEPDADADPLPTTSHSVIVSAVLLDEAGQVLSRYADWPQPFRSYDMPDPELQLIVVGDTVRLTVKRPAKAVVLRVEGEDDQALQWSDNGLDMMPGDDQTITVRGLTGRKVTADYVRNHSLCPN